ncbi:hypothetical protein [Tenuifilum thalassicum]|uniref:Uncharacterized protein n=1 Tax=Tenuifilum thalassicum TaxID=2590900 RepID=A0A7D4BQG1_9BACT|nr:hypothetical protein [Tenuifilum thalassicum]QKG78741.1 hypothetical protein FHG85_00145 [Tenuifilum thalassicum]
MGYEYKAKCKKCGKKFIVREGGGFFFHLLHCEKCGKEKSLMFNKIGDAHFQYLKGLNQPYSIATSSSDKLIQETYPGEAISIESYDDIVEKVAGLCKCGGQFRLDAPARCPKCKSTDYENTYEHGLCYD